MTVWFVSHCPRTVLMWPRHGGKRRRDRGITTKSLVSFMSTTMLSKVVASPMTNCSLRLVGGRRQIVWDMTPYYIGREPKLRLHCMLGRIRKDVKRRDTDKYLFATAGGTKATMWSPLRRPPRASA